MEKTGIQERRALISRPGFGSSGSRIQLEANHFHVSVKSPNQIFFQYSVRLRFLLSDIY